jgi:metal-responsive CopG/Arc/MetJ family transcriptional regulator
MDTQRRFEISLPTERRRELDALAAETGVSASDLARLAIVRLLASREDLLGETRARAAAA